MNPEKTGKIIHDARIKKGLTQKQLADAIAVTDKAVCKWEKGHGCPDITLLSQLSKVLVINLFAEQEAMVTLPQIGGLRLFVITNKGELFAV